MRGEALQSFPFHIVSTAFSQGEARGCPIYPQIVEKGVESGARMADFPTSCGKLLWIIRTLYTGHEINSPSATEFFEYRAIVHNTFHTVCGKVDKRVRLSVFPRLSTDRRWKNPPVSPSTVHICPVQTLHTDTPHDPCRTPFLLQPDPDGHPASIVHILSTRIRRLFHRQTSENCLTFPYQTTKNKLPTVSPPSTDTASGL